MVYKSNSSLIRDRWGGFFQSFFALTVLPYIIPTVVREYSENGGSLPFSPSPNSATLAGVIAAGVIYSHALQEAVQEPGLLVPYAITNAISFGVEVRKRHQRTIDDRISI